MTSILPSTIAFIQARTTSSRLPNKVMADIGGRPMLAWVVERTRRAASLSKVVVATTTDPADDPIVAYCQQQGYEVFRGHPTDVLDRYYQAAKQHQAFVVVRITADCPLIDPGLIDRTVRFLWGGFITSTLTAAPPYDFTANRLPPPWGRTYPIGLDVEVCTFKALEKAWQRAKKPHQREHVMPYIYETEGKFRILLVNHEKDLGHLRWTVDTPEDLQLVREIVSRFPDDTFTWLDVLELFEKEPQLAEINAHVPHKTAHDVE